MKMNAGSSPARCSSLFLASKIALREINYLFQNECKLIKWLMQKCPTCQLVTISTSGSN